MFFFVVDYNWISSIFIATREYMDIFILTIIVSAYVSLKNVFEGFFFTSLDEKKRVKRVLLGAFIAALISTIVQFVIQKYGILDIDKFTLVEYVLFFLVGFLVFSSTTIIFLKISGKKEEEDIDN
jgi:membrane-bound acyltransferase YfiQ involved in biofilm formation